MRKTVCVCVCVHSDTFTWDHRSSNLIITTSHLKSSPFNRRAEIKNWIPTLFYELTSVTNSVPPLGHLREPGHPCWDFHAMYPRTADCAHFKPFRGDCAGSTRKSNMFWSFSEVRRSILNGAQHRPCRCSLQTESLQSADRQPCPGEFLGVGPQSTAHDSTGGGSVSVRWVGVGSGWVPDRHTGPTRRARSFLSL